MPSDSQSRDGKSRSQSEDPPSFFDVHPFTKRVYTKQQPSLLSKSEHLTPSHIDGMVNFFIVLLVMYALCEFVVAYYEGNAYDTFRQTFAVVTDDLWGCLNIYMCQLALCFPFFFLQKMVQYKWISTRVCEIFHYFFITLICVHGCGVLWVFYSLNPSQSTFVLFQTAILGMKMHSFTMENNHYSKAKEELKKKDDKAKWRTDKDFLATLDAYPQNLDGGRGLFEFFTYLFMPTCVYDTNFPRMPHYRPLQIIRSIIVIASGVVVIYTILSAQILPVLRMSNELTFFHVAAKVCVPSMLLYVFIFFFIFHIVLNGYAEATRFGDCRFYDDWWNSVTYEEFARKWNKPVHYWLLRYVYKRHIFLHKNTTRAMLVTFIVSAIIHEVIMICAFRIFRPYLFGLMMLEVGFIGVGRKMPETMGKFFYWFTMFLGTPLLAVMYAREYYMVHGNTL